MIEWISNTIAEAGYLGIFFLMFLEGVFPPVPSELIMPTAGFAAGQGKLDLALVIIAGSVGSLAGTLPWYIAGYLLGLQRLKRLAGRHGRWLTLSPEELDKAQQFFLRHCGKAVLLGRLVPAVRTLISVPAGIAGMGFPRFLLFSSIGTISWTAVLAGAGYWLGESHDAVSHWLNPVGTLILAGAALWYAYRVVMFRAKPAPESSGR